ncbi:MAG TPA: PAAR domain-containing protein [Flavobacteriales bacterium]|nr:PAAR domain-containing protein [Flavobacteriales bacterium]
MPAAARVLDVTIPGGQVLGPGVPTVFIGGKVAAVMGDNHLCAIPASTGHVQPSVFLIGSTKVFINGKQALRVGDSCGCEATVAIGDPTVMIG